MTGELAEFPKIEFNPVQDAENQNSESEPLPVVNKLRKQSTLPSKYIAIYGKVLNTKQLEFKIKGNMETPKRMSKEREPPRNGSIKCLEENEELENRPRGNAYTVHALGGGLLSVPKQRRGGRNYTVSSIGEGKDLNVKINGAIFFSRIDQHEVTADFEIGKVLGQG